MDRPNEFSVLDMVKTYADENDIDGDDLFRKPPIVSEPAVEESTNEPEIPVIGKRKPWNPDQSIISTMDELNSTPAIYDRDEIKVHSIAPLKDIADDNAMNAATESMDDMTRKKYNIDQAKKRFNIKELQVPDGPFQVRIYNAAGDTNSKRAQDGLDDVFKEIVNNYPEFVLEWITQPDHTSMKDTSDTIENASPEQGESNIIDTSTESDKTKIIINKSQLPSVSWSQEEMDKIKKTRSVELNIVEDISLRYGNIEEATDNMVDAVLSQYVRKVNDVVASLPASNYRATFSGLTYTEVMDLTFSQELNAVDSEKKKWTIAFNHIKNQSIGPWESYDILDSNGEISYHVTEYEDFLRKTSFMDLEFILWKILCATAMDKEIISIDCRHKNTNGKLCGRTYDWIYSPQDLLQINSVNPSVLEEMKKTGEAQTHEDVQKQYKESMLVKNNYIELPNSKFGIIFGHVSAYDYLNSIYGEISAQENKENEVDYTNVISYSTFTAIKAFVLPKPDGGMMKVKGYDNLIKIIRTLNEIDWQTINEIVRIMIDPYQLKFSMRDIHCPQCHTKSEIPIDNISNLLFIVAQSLANVQVVLKRT